MLTTKQILLLIMCLHSLNLGIAGKSLTFYIRELNGTSLHGSCLLTGVYVSRLTFYSYMKAQSLEYFYGSVLITLQSTAVMLLTTYIILMLTNSVRILICCRIIAGLFDGTVDYCGTLLQHTASNSNKDHMNHFDIYIMSVHVLGVLIGGYIFQITRTYFVVIILVIGIQLIILCLIKNIETDHREESTSSFYDFFNLMHKDIDIIMKFDYKRDWKLVLLKLFYGGSVILYFPKSVKILFNRFHVNYLVASCTAAAEEILVSCLEYCLPYIIMKWPKIISRKGFQIQLVLYTISLIGMTNSPSFKYFMAIMIPLTIARIIINNALITKYIHAFDFMVIFEHLLYIFLPIVFGKSLEMWGMKAIRIIYLVPPAICLFIILDQEDDLEQDFWIEGRRETISDFLDNS